MPHIVSAVPLHVQQLAQGPGRPLVLSHALGLDHTMWAGVGEAFAGKRPVLAYDHRGHGRSAASAGGWSMGNLVEDAASLIESLDMGPVVFAGLSMGGMVAQGLLVHRPALLSGAVLAHTVAAYSSTARQTWTERITTVRSKGMVAVIDTVVARYLSAEFRCRYPEATAVLRQQLLSNNAESYARSCEAVASVDWLACLPQVRQRVAVIAGRHDVGAPLAESERIAAAIPGSVLHVMEHSAHLSPMEEPAAFAQTLNSFL